jgi:hypothetical protein
MNITSSRWIQEFEKQLYRRQHIVLYGNIDDQFLWRGSYQGIHECLKTYAKLSITAVLSLFSRVNSDFSTYLRLF